MNVQHKIYALTYFVWAIIRLQDKNSIKMAIFAKSEKDAGLGVRTPAGKSAVKAESHRFNTPSGNRRALNCIYSWKGNGKTCDN